MYHGKQGVRAVHFQVSAYEGAVHEIQEFLDNPHANVLKIHYAGMAEGEKWALILYEEVSAAPGTAPAADPADSSGDRP